MKRTVYLMCISLFVIIACSKSSPITSIDEEEQIKNTLIAMWDAIEKGDIDRYATYIHEDFTAFGENDSLLTIGKEDEVQGIKAWIERSGPIKTQMHRPKVTINGNTAWISYYWSDSGTTDGKEFATEGKSTRIFIKENDTWLCTHGHYSYFPGK